MEELTFQNVHFEARCVPARSAVRTLTRLTPALQCWDLGGQQALRMTWTSYFQDTDAVVLVVDSTDRTRTALVKARPRSMPVAPHFARPSDAHAPQLELQRLLECDSLAGACILVFANKQDLREAMGVAELTAVLGLQSVRTHEWHVQPACALTGEGLHDGLGWIVQRVTRGLSSVAAPRPSPEALLDDDDPFPLPPAPPPPALK